MGFSLQCEMEKWTILLMTCLLLRGRDLVSVVLVVQLVRSLLLRLLLSLHSRMWSKLRDILLC
jgi:hypothetical protein